MELVQIENSNPKLAANLNLTTKFALFMIAFGLVFTTIVLFAGSLQAPELMLTLSIISIITGSVLFIYEESKLHKAGINNTGIFYRSVTSRGAVAWLLGAVITLFYILLYWWPEYLENLIRLFDPWAYLVYGGPADQWFMYGAFYTLAVLIMGLRMVFVKYRHSKYHKIRTFSIMFFQFGFAFIIPYILKGLNQPDFYFTYFWPLKYNYLFPQDVNYLVSHPGGLGAFMVFWGAIMTFLATPVLTYFFGKRWYCSWVCGCGGLANTLGDPWRHLSDKSLRAWKIERYTIHSILLLIIVTTGLLWLNEIYGNEILNNATAHLKRAYGFFIGAIFSGVIGVGFYPILGTRVWCRFGCPMAAILGIQQKFFSRFRITTNGGQCISCGNCSTYCEMGIDVRSYAQKGQNIVRASCVGCGVCSAVCPRGVLRLENGPVKNRVPISQFIK